MNFGSATSGQLATMRNNNKPADSSSMSKHQCLQSQLSFESGLQVERLTGFTDEWSVSSARSKLVVPELVNVDVGNNNYRSRLCHEVEAFEGAATRVMGPEERDGFAGGHVQQDNSSATSPEQTEAAAAAALQHGDPGHTHSGKRKAAGKDLTISNTNSGKVSEGDEIHMNVKCPKSSHHSSKSKSADRSPTSEQTYSGGLSPKSLKASSKLQEPPHPKQDYIHVRARRGQATDSHSLAERVRREKISERMKFLQDLVPGCSKVTGKAVMLDEIINYVQSLQRQIEFLSMKLAAVDPQPDINLENLLNKELAVQARSPETTLMGPDPSAGLYREYQSHLQIQQQINTCNMDLRSVGTLCDAYLRSSMNYAPVQLEPLAFADHSFVDPVTQTLNGVVCDGDLQNIVHMGNTHAGRQDFFGQGRLHGGPGFLTPGFLKVEY